MKKGRVFWTPLRTTLTAVLLVVIGTIAGFVFLKGYDMPLFFPSGEVGAHERDLLVFTMLLSLVVIIPVYSMLIIFSIRYRKNGKYNKKAAYTPEFENSKIFEAVLWGIPVLLIAILGTVTWVTSHTLDPHRHLDSKVEPIRVQVVTMQWRWLFIYPDQHVASMNQLKIPAGTPVNFEITADAPMSSFWIPALGTQVYSMAGMNSKLSLVADKPGMYRGTNTNINGRGYSSMDFDVVAVGSRSEFNHWVDAIKERPENNDLTWDLYENLATPTENSSVVYYTLKDSSLFNMILNKYMNKDNSAIDGVKTKEMMQGARG